MDDLHTNWINKSLGDLINIDRGYAFKSEDYKPNGIPIFRVTNIEDNGTLNVYDDIVFLDREKAEQYSEYLLNNNDVLIVMVGATVGKLGLAKENIVGYLLNQNMWRLTTKSETDCSQLFFYYALHPIVEDFLDTLQGSASGFLTQKAFAKIKFSIPPFAEQKKIATILTSVDTVIEKTQAQIDKLNDLKTGMMAELLTKGIGPDGKPHTEFKDSPVGRIPAEWECQQLKEYLSLISYGFTNPMPESDDGPLMVTARDVKNLEIQKKTARRTTLEAYKNLLTDKSRPLINDLLLTKDGTLGRVALVEEAGICINQSVAVLRHNEKILPKFLLYLLDSAIYQQKMIDNAGGSTIKHIYITIVDKMNVAVPCIDEQKRIVKIAENLTLRLKQINLKFCLFKKICG